MVRKLALMGMTIFRNNIPVILIDKHIGFDDVYGAGIMGSDFVRELNAIENHGYTSCEVWINTVGGSVIDGLAIYNAIVNSTIEVNTRNVGVALSTGGWLMQAGKKRIANYYTKGMMHGTSGGDEKALTALNTTVSSMLSIRCKKSDAWVQERMNDETWFSAEDGLKLGLYDEIDYNCGADVKDNFDNKKPFAAYNAMMLIVNKLVEEPIKKIQMEKVTNALNLNKDAAEDSILKEINNLKDQLKNTNDKLVAKEAELLKVTSEAKAAEVEKEAVEFIENAFKEGRFVKEAKEGFLALAKNNFEATKTAVMAMPIQKTANKVTITNTVVNGESRAGWDYTKWEKEDPAGLTNMYKNSKAEYDALLDNWKNKIAIK